MTNINTRNEAIKKITAGAICGLCRKPLRLESEKVLADLAEAQKVRAEELLQMVGVCAEAQKVRAEELLPIVGVCADCIDECLF